MDITEYSELLYPQDLIYPRDERQSPYTISLGDEYQPLEYEEIEQEQEGDEKTI